MPEEPTATPGPARLTRLPAGALAQEAPVPVLVEFHAPPLVVYKHNNPLATAAQLQAYSDGLRAEHARFLQSLNDQGIDSTLSGHRTLSYTDGNVQEVRVDHDFIYLFNGIGLLVPGQRLAELAGQPGVKAITGNHEVPYLNQSHSVPFIGAPAVWEKLDRNGKPCDGEGVTIAVIDTGIDWRHPAFGGFESVPNPKVVFAVSFTGEPAPDNFGHGSHCAGIAAGDLYQGTPRGDSQIQGVAPKAQLMSFKVLTARGSGTAAGILAAMEGAVLLGAHVINLSLGDTLGDPQSPESVVANHAMLAGTVVCCAAGNSGPGASTIGSPGSADLALTVGASTDDSVTATYAHVAGGAANRLLETRLLHGSPPLDNMPALPYVQCGRGETADDFPAAVSGQIALIDRGAVSFRQKATLAQAAGAVAAVIANNQPGNFWGTLGEPAAGDPELTLPVLSIALADGDYLVKLGFAAEGLSRQALQLDPTEVPIPDHLAEFSSRGPNQDLAIKPELCAPGVNIYSATITQGPPDIPNMADPSGYTTASGTSMATPHMAGAAALLRQLHPDWTPLWIKAALVNTAHWLDGQGSVADQGNGRVDLAAAASVPLLLVTEADQPQPWLSFGTVEHQGELTSVTSTLRLIDVSDRGGRYSIRTHLARRSDGLSVATSHRQVTLGRDGTRPFDLTVTVDGRTLADGAYYGFVSVKGNGASLRLPFALTTQASAGNATRPGPTSAVISA